MDQSTQAILLVPLLKLDRLYVPHRPTKRTSTLIYIIELNGPCPQLRRWRREQPGAGGKSSFWLRTSGVTSSTILYTLSAPTGDPVSIMREIGICHTTIAPVTLGLSHWHWEGYSIRITWIYIQYQRYHACKTKIGKTSCFYFFFVFISVFTLLILLTIHYH